MLRRAIIWLSLTVAGLAGVVWIAQRSGEKILYADRSLGLYSIEMEIMIHTERGRPSGPASETFLYVLADEGSLMIHLIGYAGKKPNPEFTKFMRRLGLTDFSSAMRTIVDVRTARVPLAPLASSCLGLAAVLLGTPAFVRWRRRRRNLCLECGYSLAFLTENRCPECGTGFRRTDSHTGTAENES